MGDHRRRRDKLPYEVVVMTTLIAVAVFSLVASVFVGGQTFGQRCRKVYSENTPQYDACVIRLSHPTQSVKP